MTYIIFKMENRVFISYTENKTDAINWSNTKDENGNFIYDYQTVNDKEIMLQYWSDLNEINHRSGS